MDLLFRFLFCLSFVLLSVAQTQTIVDAAGNSVVVVVTADAAGAPLTQTIQTLAPGGQAPPGQAPPGQNPPPTPTTDTTTLTTITPPANPPGQGPVAEPGDTPTAAGGVTPYTYTTVINGVTTAVQDNFTPSNPRTTPTTPTGQGTVWDFSQYMSEFGGAAATGGGGGRNAGSQNKASGGLALMTCMFTILML